MELDLYWVLFAGKDPLDLFKQYPGCFPLWHMNDMEKSKCRTLAEVGTGSINFQRLLDHQKLARLEYFLVNKTYVSASTTRIHYDQH